MAKQQKQQQQPLTVSTAPAAAGLNGDTLVVTIAGELGIQALIGPDAKHSGIAEDNALDKALAKRLDNPPALVIIDLTPVTYMASVGIGALLRLKKRVEAAGSQTRFVGTAGLVTLLKHSHLDKVLKLHPTVDAALAEP